MPFTGTEAKILAALFHAPVSQTVQQLAVTTGISVRALNSILGRLKYEDQVYDDRAGWQLSLRGRTAISASRYHDIVAGLRPERHNLTRKQGHESP